MTKCLVTGGAGFIGSNLVAALLEHGYEVRVLDNFSTGRPENLAAFRKEIEVFEADLKSKEAVRRAVAGMEIVFHQGAVPSVPRSIADPLLANEVNVSGTLNVLLAARDSGVRRIVYASSSSVYGDNLQLPKVEEMPASPLSPYAVTKLAGELYSRLFFTLYGLETLGLRYFNVYGPRQNPESQYAAVIPKFIKVMLNGKPPTVYGDGEQSRDFTFVGDVVKANLLAAQVKGVAGEVLNIACSRRVTLNQLLEMLRKVIGSGIEAVYVKERPGDIRHSLASIKKARKLLGYKPETSLENGLALAVEWFKKDGPVEVKAPWDQK